MPCMLLPSHPPHLPPNRLLLLPSRRRESACPLPPLLQPQRQPQQSRQSPPRHHRLRPPPQRAPLQAVLLQLVASRSATRTASSWRRSAHNQPVCCSALAVVFSAERAYVVSVRRNACSARRTRLLHYSLTNTMPPPPCSVSTAAYSAAYVLSIPYCNDARLLLDQHHLGTYI